MFIKLIMVSLIGLGSYSRSLASNECHDKPGALIIAHGSHKMNHGHHNFQVGTEEEASNGTSQSSDPWNDTVTSAVAEAQTKINFPIALAFGMWDRNSFEKGIQQLADLGVCELRIIPLFVSSQSEMIDVQKYMFGVSNTKLPPIPVEKVTIPPQIQSVNYGKALDDHSVVSEILAERVAQISRNSAKEGLIFIGHGPYGDFYDTQWQNLLRLHRERVVHILKQQNIYFSEFSEVVLRDDSPPAVRNERTRLLRAKVEELNQRSLTPLIIPVLLSSGGIEAGIFERLKGLNYKIQDQFLMPHLKMVDWIAFRAQQPLD